MTLTTETRTPQEEVEKVRNYFRSIGMAHYSINGLDEDESILSFIREKNSFKYALVRCPYSRSKNLVWRLMKVDIWRPSLPMGYYGSPAFTFDYMGNDALKEAGDIANMLMGRKYSIKYMDRGNNDAMMERISMKKIKSDEESVPLSDEDKYYLKQRNYNKIIWK